MMNFAVGFWFVLVWLVWLGIAIYLLMLATRFVNAVERIADNMRS